MSRRGTINKRLYISGAGLVLVLVLFYFLAVTYEDLQVAKQRNENLIWNLTKMSLLGVFLGIVVEMKKIVILFKDRIKVNWLLVPTLLLLVLTFIPNIYWLDWFSLDIPFYLQVFLFPSTHLAIATATGVLLIKSFVRVDTDLDS